jgi:hypothetical protein
MLSTIFCRAGAGTALCLLAACLASPGADDPFKMHKQPPIVGRWDLTVKSPDGEYPSWFEVRQSGYRTLVGTFVGRFGSARPIGHVEYDNGNFRFKVPPQWERRTDDLIFEGKVEGEVLRGQSTDDKGRRVTFEGRPAPSLKRTAMPHWGEPVEIFNGRDLAGWRPQMPGVKNGWVVRDAILTNATPGNNLLTEKKFNDFKLHAEFRYPARSNSGIYLRGRYEVQIEDNYGDEPDSHKIGGVYGFLTPSVNAGKKAGEWQTLEITLVGRVVTVVLNGERIIDRQAIPGPTGGALDSNEGEPGPILLQGDHGPIDFRQVTLIPGD